jgi:hypothetical protein
VFSPAHSNLTLWHIISNGQTGRSALLLRQWRDADIGRDKIVSTMGLRGDERAVRLKNKGRMWGSFTQSAPPTNHPAHLWLFEGVQGDFIALHIPKGFNFEGNDWS